ncbi:MAG: hypothetical protein JWM14_963 [Chitinophagaceae bacterium]|nr:hypothetical protein [Chitinophagaceae bacterium]
MKRIATIIFATILLVTSAYISSCKKKKEDANPNDGLTTETNEAQSQWDDALKISEDAINANGQSSRTSSYPAITLVTGSGTTGTITIDYGTDGLTASSDGKYRKGKLVITYTDKYRNSGAVITTSTNSYYVNGKHIKGRRTVTNNGSYIYSVVDSDSLGTAASYAEIIYPNAEGTTTWKSTRTRTWTAGYGTIGTLSDDVYSISGTASGVSKEGKAYTMTITNLIVKLECFFTYFIYMPAGGTIDINTTEGTRSVNYGNGVSCDRNVTFTAIDGKTYELSL